ncbi:MAG: S8 family peptidase [Steroidobacteraceae bacterium]|nr:S8 family peptidase [Steroidobacteraceae bacterium]
MTISARVLGAAAIVVSMGVLASCSAATSGTPSVTGKGLAEQSYIVEASSTDAAAKAVADAGGDVTSRLGIIDAVEANLTDAEHAKVLETAGIRQITTNTIVTTQRNLYQQYSDAQAGVSSANHASVRDTFEVGSFANNNGSHRWWGDWVETNDDNSPYGGTSSIGWPERNGRRLIVSSNAAIHRRAATPSSSATVTLKFKALRVGLETGDYLSVQASKNGGTSWTEVGRLSGAANESTFASYTYNITAYRGRDTTIRFLGVMNGAWGTDGVLIDDVEIAYTTTFGEGDAVPVDVNATGLHQAGFRGKDIGVAVIDTGFWKIDGLDKDSGGTGRVAAQYDAIRNVLDTSWSSISTDTTGHGTHITSLIASSRRDSSGRFYGVAPDARLISIKAFDETGASTYATVIRGIDWVVTNRLPYAIKVLNLSLGAPARSRYWDDPLNKAVMRAWQSGIVVVVSAGNSGPLPQTVGVPGNVPYVITVGAMTDNFTTSKNDDRLASFSSTGPTFEGFVKPDLVAPGGHVWGYMGTYMKIAVDHPTYMNSGDFFTMSGTSQSAAAVSGVVALVLSKNPGLTPDQVKCRIIASGKPAVTSDGKAAYSVFQQGTGLVDATAAANGTTNNCANVGLNVAADLAGTQHFMGRATQLSDGSFKVTTPNSQLWEQGKLWDQGFLWSQSYLWNQGFLWPQGQLWPQGFNWNQGATYASDIPWVDGYPSTIGSSVGTASSMSINSWVAPE